MKELKPKKCRHKQCKAIFTPKYTGTIACSPECAIAIVTMKREAKEQKLARQAHRQTKERLKTRSQWIKEAQAVFNSFIRARDRHQLCICCDKPLGANEVGGNFDAGHYRSVGSAPHLRFDERNCHAQRKYCNRYGSGRAVDYRIGLIKRLGVKAVELLEADQAPKKYSVADIEEIKKLYKLKLKETQ